MDYGTGVRASTEISLARGDRVQRRRSPRGLCSQHPSRLQVLFELVSVQCRERAIFNSNCTRHSINIVKVWPQPTVQPGVSTIINLIASAGSERVQGGGLALVMRR